MKHYTITYGDMVDGYDQVELTIDDLASFFKQIRGFPSILYLGSLAGEGQSGGRFVTDVAKQLEEHIIDDLGVEEYTQQMDILMGVTA